MDLEEWEFLHNDGLLDYHDSDGGKKITRRGSEVKSIFNINMNYFICPSPKLDDSPANPKVPPNPPFLVPIQLEQPPVIGKKALEDLMTKEIMTTKVPIEISVKEPPPILEGGDLDMVSQVFFKKTLKENEFVDMKMDSPKSNSRAIMPPSPIDSSNNFRFDEKSESLENKITSPRLKTEKDQMLMSPNSKEEVSWEGEEVDDNVGGLNIWKLGLTGIGAICSVGVTAATICILVFGNRQRNKHHLKNQKLRFQLYTDDKRIKQVVHHATKLNEAISAARGVPLTRAHITFGGYYDAI